jgi:CRP/FNR family cyclic AMP-dependent transcriptional regulator
MRRHNTTIERLGAVPLFAACQRAELMLIARTLCEHHVPAGRILMRQGDVGRDFAVIVDGTATVLVDDRAIATLGAGALVGEIAVLDRRPRTATVVAETDLVTQVGTASDLVELIAHAPNMTRKVLAGLAGRLRAATLEVAP